MKRIQAEINEVEQREREHRQKLASAATMLTQSTDGDFVDDAGINHQTIMSPISDGHSSLSSTPDKDPCDSVSAFSDDSGISSASSPVNGQSANEIVPTKAITNINATPKYIRLNTVQNTITAKPYNKSFQTNGVAAKIITRTTSTPQIFVPGITPRFQINPAKKGLMQRFIATRGKIAAAAVANANANNNNGNNINSINGNGLASDDETHRKINSFAGKRNNSILVNEHFSNFLFLYLCSC